MVASVASAWLISSQNAQYLARKFWASVESEELPFSFAIMFQVAKSARALVSARLAIILSVALINLPRASFCAAQLHVAGHQQNQANHKAGGCVDDCCNNIKT